MRVRIGMQKGCYGRGRNASCCRPTPGIGTDVTVTGMDEQFVQLISKFIYVCVHDVTRLIDLIRLDHTGQ